MKEYEALRLKADAMEMVEGTELKWWQVVKYHSEDGTTTIEEHALCMDRNQYKLAIGIVEGKPVWEGESRLYCDEYQDISQFVTKALLKKYKWSWNPPKPKTVLVELTVEDAEAFGNEPMFRLEDECIRIAEACRKALEGVK